MSRPVSAAPDLAGQVADVVRFSVPWTGALALVGPRESLPRLPRATVLPDAGAVPAWFGTVPEELPAYAVALEPPDRARLAQEFRLVVSEEGICEVFALRSAVPPRETAARDGLPLPPPEMVQLVAGLGNPARFYQRFIAGGRREAARIEQMLERSGLGLSQMRSVLDFGCGCGRVMRQWKDLRGPRLHGTDYNPYLVRWCEQHLPFADFSVNGLEPGLELPDDQFDLVYCYSVFTHLPADMQAAWLAELVRVTAPGGHLWLTFHGEHAVRSLGAPEQERFTAGELVVVMMRGEDDLGTNACAAYHPHAYVRDQLAASLDVIDFVPGDLQFIQDAYVLRKPRV